MTNAQRLARLRADRKARRVCYECESPTFDQHVYCNACLRARRDDEAAERRARWAAMGIAPRGPGRPARRAA